METSTKLAFERLRRARVLRLVETGVLDADVVASASEDFGLPDEPETPTKRSPYLFVYVFRCKGMYKIGRSVDPEWRLKQLQTASAEPIELIHLIKTRKQGLERALHRRFNHARQSGEWFALTPDDLDWIQRFGNTVKC